MAYFRVKTNTLTTSAIKMQAGSALMTSYILELNAITNGLSLDSSAAPIIKSKLRDISNAMSRERKGIQSMSSALNTTALDYIRSESKIVANVGGKATISSAVSKGVTLMTDAVGAADTKKDKFDYKYEKLWSVVGKFGAIGGGIGAFGKLFTSKMGTKDWISFGKNVWTTGGNIVSGILKKKSPLELFTGLKNVGFNSVKQFGLNVVCNVRGGNYFASFTKNVFDEIGKYSFKGAKTVGDKAAVVTKWGGFLLTAAEKGYSNFTDKDNSVGRAIAETASETLIETGLGIAGTALVATVAGPGIVAAAGGAAVVWAADVVYRKLTGSEGGLVEDVSDAILDTGKAVVDVGVKAAKKTVEIAKDVGKGAVKAGKAAVKWVKGLFK